jgi:hypothetical protein
MANHHPTSDDKIACDIPSFFVGGRVIQPYMVFINKEVFLHKKQELGHLLSAAAACDPLQFCWSHQRKRVMMEDVGASVFLPLTRIFRLFSDLQCPFVS